MNSKFKSWLNNIESIERFRESLSFNKVDLVYTPLHLNEVGFDFETDLGYPGEFPFTRGIHKTMYRQKLWTMRQFAGFGSPEETNSRFKYLLQLGQTGLSVAFDMPTLMGFDADDEMAQGEVGREGVNVSSLLDMEILLADINLEAVTTSMTINATAPIIFAFFVAAAKKRGFDLTKISGTIQNDMLKEFIAQKEWIVPPQPSVRLACDIIEYSVKHLPKFNPISISGYHIREAGATAYQELNFTLCDGIEYVEQLLKRSLAIDDFAPRLSFFFDVHNDFFEEISKLRAARKIWAKLMKDYFKAQNPRSWLLRMHAQTAGVSLTAQQPQNNIVRVAIQALAAVLGGVQSLHTNSMDETLSLPTEQAVKLALRTQQIIAEETHVTDTIDPLGGSYYVEFITKNFEKEFFNFYGQISQLGGMLHAVEKGLPQRLIAESSYRFQKKVDSEEEKIVGVNCFVDKKEEKIDIHSVNPAVEELQKERLKKLKLERSNRAVYEKIDCLKQTLARGQNCIPALIECALVGCTLGELSRAFQDIFGLFKERSIF